MEIGVLWSLLLGAVSEEEEAYREEQNVVWSRILFVQSVPSVRARARGASINAAIITEEEHVQRDLTS